MLHGLNQGKGFEQSEWSKQTNKPLQQFKMVGNK